ncbi:citryl-CoA lyase [Mycolicibacterium peregrinum]|uniref:citryl-CoA lyase n=1 Tax=Mycolicibacterium peregrinum TaxID=43304 RepID=UPI0006D76486|nr:citryl-CoA lyase [Mycolicibacterium peregrinum]MCV7203821.1 citryl-CoA lyase [Mycolicibacterium peregrinum]ORW58192.1 citryl-CoA lyase [Mycolicibacterium peregrinum]OWM10446.1 citryl-CoA lyase [Mycolicibacterium peregrinum]
MNNPTNPPTTSIGHSTADSIQVCGHDLAAELMGTSDFGSVFFLLVTGRLPEAGEARCFNAILVALADHGLTPSALATRLTYTGAPEAIQGAVAAGLLGGGAVFLGVFENAGRMLRADAPPPDATDSELSARARRLVDDHRSRGVRVPGLGHPIHKGVDPRVTRLFEIAEQEHRVGPHTRLMQQVQIAASTPDNPLPLNAGGASGALLCDLGVDPESLRGVALVSRAAGLVGHVVEEARQPLGRWLWDTAEEHVEYVAPGAGR